VQKFADYYPDSRVFSQDFAAQLPPLPQLTVYARNSRKPKTVKSIKKARFSKQIGL
jgi:hypothetical protein